MRNNMASLLIGLLSIYAIPTSADQLGSAPAAQEAQHLGMQAPPVQLSGKELRTWLRKNWYAGKFEQLGYKTARKEMYSFIDVSDDGRVYGVYTGFSQVAQKTTFLDPINAEHTIPQSWFGKREPMKSDVHHLFPTHGIANSTRNKYPFAEIEDTNATDWLGIQSSNTFVKQESAPSANLDMFSEYIDGLAFEPKEDHKGNLARAIFYFYTMYPYQAGSINKIIYNGGLPLLLRWHTEDKVDSFELTRNKRAFLRQGNLNPYVIYPDLACRAWKITICPETTETDRE